jgi:hypothetical protein
LSRARSVRSTVDPVAGVAAVERGEQLEVAAPAQIRIERRRFDESGDAVERLDGLLRIAAEQPHGSGGRPDQPKHHPQAGRLAGPVGTEVSVHVACVDREVHAGDRFQLAVALDQSPDLDRRRSAGGRALLLG